MFTLTLDDFIEVRPEKKTIDAKVTQGSLNGKTMLGIYKVEKGMLHVCWAEIDAKRPTKFVTTKPGGWGMGLALARRIVEQQHGGRLVYHGAGPGATFVMEFPATLA